MVVLVSVNMFQQHRCVLHWHGKVQLAHLRSRLSAALALRTAAEMWPSGPTSTLVGSVRLPQGIVMICHFDVFWPEGTCPSIGNRLANNGNSKIACCCFRGIRTNALITLHIPHIPSQFPVKSISGKSRKFLNCFRI